MAIITAFKSLCNNHKHDLRKQKGLLSNHTSIENTFNQLVPEEIVKEA